MSEWHKQILYTTLAGVGFASDDIFRKHLAKRGLTIGGIGLGAVGARFAVEGAGLAISHAIGGKQGVEHWQEASAQMYDWGVLGKVPVLGQVIQLVPNPWGVGQVLGDATIKIIESLWWLPDALDYYAAETYDFVTEAYDPFLVSPDELGLR